MEKVKCTCGYETTEPVHWEKIWQGFRFNIKTNDWGGTEKGDSAYDDDNYWACPDCGEAYSDETQAELDEIMQG
jgi:hypothetical protein